MYVVHIYIPTPRMIIIYLVPTRLGVVFIETSRVRFMTIILITDQSLDRLDISTNTTPNPYIKK